MTATLVTAGAVAVALVVASIVLTVRSVRAQREGRQISPWPMVVLEIIASFFVLLAVVALFLVT